jgi:cation diffusion facilitator CzcD-associated flavoprotein CzcO
VLHSVDYRRPDGFHRQRVLVVGAGNSAGEIAVELARAGAWVTLGVRTGADVVPREIAGIPIQYFAVPLSALPRPAQRVVSGLIARASALVRGPSPLPRAPRSECPNVPLIGLHLAEALRIGAIRLAGRVAAFSGQRVRFDDGSAQPFDSVILATGYRAALGLLDGIVRVDPCGFGLRRNGVVSVDQPRLYFVGHNYDLRGALFNIRRDARRAASQLTSEIGGTSRTSTETRPGPSER